ncbi:unnamed protein product [Arctia plantaginis]|uniref:Uncharacterized protein n=1 Tax=Arctia plantaginis TaxID=874455 RepID=A0A8S1BG15_ARCPL|nr:unnamed protein product [Arctia plantaginis]
MEKHVREILLSKWVSCYLNSYFSKVHNEEVFFKTKAIMKCTATCLGQGANTVSSAELIEERKKGKIAFLKYDKLVVKENETTNEKRKRETSSSPHSSDIQPKRQQATVPFKANRTNAFDMMRMRSNSLTIAPTSKQQ